MSFAIVTEKSQLSASNSPKRPAPMEWTRNIGIAAHIDAAGCIVMERKAS